MQFEFYVLNYNFNKRKVEMYNIFNNIHVQEYTEKAVKRYLQNPKRFKYVSYMPAEEICGFEGFVKEIDRIIKWEEWSRCEYEIGVGYAFSTSEDKLEKWDCYQQTHANIEMIAHEVIRQYKKYLKNQKED